MELTNLVGKKKKTCNRRGILPCFLTCANFGTLFAGFILRQARGVDPERISLPSRGVARMDYLGWRSGKGVAITIS